MSARRAAPKPVDTYLAVASRRDERRYAVRRVPEDVVERILDAGRLAGSAKNRQPWRFIVVETRELLEQLAERVYEPSNVRGAALVVALVGSGFDLGRAAQNMLLTAWNEGLLSCPNGLTEREEAAALLGLREGEQLAYVLTFGYPRGRRDPEARSAREWSARAKRKPLAELVTRV
jgi:nitroreductase